MCTCYSFPISALLSLVRNKDQEKKLWNYIGPSIIQLNPKLFSRLQELDPLQINILLRNSDYKGYDTGDTFTLENGGILFEGIIEEYSSDSNQNKPNNKKFGIESEEGTNKDSIQVKNYSFIYPSNSIYSATSDVRIYAFPAELKQAWFSPNPQILYDSFIQLPGAAVYMNYQNRYREGMKNRLNQEDALLLDIPKELASANPIQQFRNEFGRQKDHSIYTTQLLRDLESEMSENAIMPKGLASNMDKLAITSPQQRKYDSSNSNNGKNGDSLKGLSEAKSKKYKKLSNTQNMPDIRSTGKDTLRFSVQGDPDEEEKS